MTIAVEPIRRMRGGAQAHLMCCNDEGYYVVKFQNNPQGTRILANELLATRLAARVGLPVPSATVVEVGDSLVENTDDLVIQMARGRAKCRPGLQFGSRYPGSPAGAVVFDFLPDEALRQVRNLRDFCGMLVFDKWTCNTDGRQAIFFQPRGDSRYQAQMIDQGFCFNAAEWNFPDAPLRGLYARHLVYEAVTGFDAFEPWLGRVENFPDAALEESASEIPPDWYAADPEALDRLLAQLARRRALVRDLIVSAWKSSAQPFPHWKE